MLEVSKMKKILVGILVLCCWIAVGCDCPNPVAGNPTGNVFKFINKTWGGGKIDVSIRDMDTGKEKILRAIEYGYLNYREHPVEPFREYEIIYIIPKYKHGQRWYTLRSWDRRDNYVYPESGTNGGFIERISPTVIDSYDWKWTETDPP